MTAPDTSSTLMMGAGLAGNTGGVSEVAPGVIYFPYFGNVTAFLTADGILVVDTSLATNGAGIVRELRRRTDLPVRTIVYTHGHIDHVTGADAFLADAAARRDARPTVVGHKLVAPRLQRYERMAGWINRINSIQFGMPVDADAPPPPRPAFAYPAVTYDDRTTITVGRESFELTHGLGETDDHTWLYAPDRNVVCSGDFFIWTCPNVGNPWKVQRYAEGWADGLEAIAARTSHGAHPRARPRHQRRRGGPGRLPRHRPLPALNRRPGRRPHEPRPMDRADPGRSRASGRSR